MRAAIGGLRGLLVREGRRECDPPGAPARSNISPASLGPSLTLYSAASALTWPSENSGPPCSARLRKASSLIEWQFGADLPVDLEAALKLRRVEVCRTGPRSVQLWRGGCGVAWASCGLSRAAAKAPQADEGESGERRLDGHDLRLRSSAQPLVFGDGGGARRHGAGRAALAEHRLGDRGRHLAAASRTGRAAAG